MKHDIRMDIQNEYDELGNLTGQSYQEICVNCGARTDLMDSPADCEEN